ncbi:MAG TPA: Xaa-Pro aminopeptidase [Humisphaera sp.]
MLPPPATSADAAAEVKPPLLPPPPPLDGFPAEEFKARRDALRAALPDGIILIRGAAEDDLPHNLPVRYRQNAAFFYLTGVDTPGCYLALLPAGVPANTGLKGVKPEVREVLFVPARDGAMEQWSGAKLGPGEETQKLTGIEHAADAAKFWAAVTNWSRRAPTIHTLMPFGEQAKGSRPGAMIQRLADLTPTAQFKDCSLQLAGLRIVKSPAEVERMRQAVATTDAGHRVARDLIAKGAGRRENEVEAAVFHTFRARGAQLGFSSIIGAGVNGSVLHYEHNDAELKTGDLVVVDIGARVGHYNGDVTRTYPVGGKFGPRQREIYELVLACQRDAVERFKVGVDSLDAMTERAREFYKASKSRAKNAAGEEKTMDAFFPHSLGHHLGLDVHDVNDAADRHTPLPIGSLITIEPGLYLPNEGIGVRIEDDYLLTEQGFVRVGEPLEATVEELERAMR